MKTLGYTAVFVAILAFAGTVHAQDIYVKPSQPSQTDRPAPDLGMVPRQPEPKPATETPKAPEPVPQPVQPIVDYSPPAGSSGGSSVEQVNENLQIIKIDAKPDPNPQGKGGNYLSISVKPGGIGSYDKSVVASNLGLSESEIVSNCYLEYQGMVTYGKGDADMLLLSSGGTTNYRFEGTLSGVNIFPTIACRKVKRPLSGMIIEENGFYKVSGMAANCQAPGKQGSISLTFKYLGDGQAVCQFN